MTRELQESFQKTLVYSAMILVGVTILGLIWQPEQWIAICCGCLLGTSASGLATYFLYQSSIQLLNVDQEEAVQAQLKSYGLRFGIYLFAMGITIVGQNYFAPLFVIIGFLIPKIAIVIEAYRFNQQSRG
ncbi:MAG: hypothetical protein ACRC5Q_00810 [Culicoidibacterales bacterium]